MFDNYYRKYMNYDHGMMVEDCLVCKSEMRDIPLNKRFIYRIIITDYNAYRIVSVSPSISDIVIYNLCCDIKDKVFDDLAVLQILSITGLRISKMYRMLLLDNQNITKEDSNPNFTVEYRSDTRKFLIRDCDNIVSYCKIGDIDFQYGNIVIWTDEKYRRKGFARELLLMTIEKCKEEGIVPIYLVDSQNYASIELAKSAGFKVVQQEIIACEVCGNPVPVLST